MLQAKAKKDTKGDVIGGPNRYVTEIIEKRNSRIRELRREARQEEEEEEEEEDEPVSRSRFILSEAEVSSDEDLLEDPSIDMPAFSLSPGMLDVSPPVFTEVERYTETQESPPPSRSKSHQIKRPASPLSPPLKLKRRASKQVVGSKAKDLTPRERLSLGMPAYKLPPKAVVVSENEDDEGAIASDGEEMDYESGEDELQRAEEELRAREAEESLIAEESQNFGEESLRAGLTRWLKTPRGADVGGVSFGARSAARAQIDTPEGDLVVAMHCANEMPEEPEHTHACMKADDLQTAVFMQRFGQTADLSFAEVLNMIPYMTAMDYVNVVPDDPAAGRVPRKIIFNRIPLSVIQSLYRRTYEPVANESGREITIGLLHAASKTPHRERFFRALSAAYRRVFSGHPIWVGQNPESYPVHFNIPKQVLQQVVYTAVAYTFKATSADEIRANVEAHHTRLMQTDSQYRKYTKFLRSLTGHLLNDVFQRDQFPDLVTKKVLLAIENANENYVVTGVQIPSPGLLSDLHVILSEISQFGGEEGAVLFDKFVSVSDHVDKFCNYAMIKSCLSIHSGGFHAATSANINRDRNILESIRIKMQGALRRFLEKEGRL